MAKNHHAAQSEFRLKKLTMKMMLITFEK